MKWLPLTLITLVAITAHAKTHTVFFGKAMTVQWFVTPDHSEPLKVRPLYIDAHIRDFTTGEVHEITDNRFVVRQAYRINDALPQDKKAPDWKWQRGGWLLVERDRGRVNTLNLPEFDAFYSAVSWYRDFAAYCGVSENGVKSFAMVAQVGRKKPVARKELGEFQDSAAPDSICSSPVWRRDPATVTFTPAAGSPLTLNIHGQPAAPVIRDDGEEP